MFDFSLKKYFSLNFNSTLLFNHNTYRCKLQMEDVQRDPKNTSDMWFVSVNAVVDAFHAVENFKGFRRFRFRRKIGRRFQSYKTHQPLHVQIQTTYQECSSDHVEHLSYGIYICTCRG